MTNQVKIKSSKTSLKKTQNNILSIQFSLDGFSFCVSDSNSKETLYFSEILFEKQLNDLEELLEEIINIFKDNATLHLDYQEVFVIHQNNLNTIVPESYFDEKLLRNYLNFNIKVLQTDFITFDTIQEINAKNVYIPYININNYLFQNFGGFEYKHHSTIFIEKLMKKNQPQEKTMFVNVSERNIDVVILQYEKLLFSNSFLFNTKEDFIYYILFVSEQLQLDNKVFKLYFVGEINTTSGLYQITYKYVKNVNFLESNNPIFKEINCEKHSNYLLLG